MSLDEWLEAVKMTDVALAGMLGVSREYARLLRFGRRSPSVAVAERIGEITGGEVTGDDLEVSYVAWRNRSKEEAV